MMGLKEERWGEFGQKGKYSRERLVTPLLSFKFSSATPEEIPTALVHEQKLNHECN